MLKIILACSNNLISQGINCILSGDDDLLISTVSDVVSLDIVLKDEKPDVLIADYYVLDNFLSPVCGNTKVLLLDTGCGEEKINYALIAKNISGVIEMHSDVPLLKKAIATVKKGHLWINRKVISNLVSRLSVLSKLWNLTESEQQVLQLIGKGMEDSVIAKTLGTKESKVRLHIESLKKKSTARDRWDLINISREYFDVNMSSN